MASVTNVFVSTTKALPVVPPIVIESTQVITPVSPIITTLFWIILPVVESNLATALSVEDAAPPVLVQNTVLILLALHSLVVKVLASSTTANTTFSIVLSLGLLLSDTSAIIIKSAATGVAVAVSVGKIMFVIGFEYY